jgi:ankyrin repeat protein
MIGNQKKIMFAIRNNNLDEIKNIINNNDLSNYNKTIAFALYSSALYGRYDIVAFLLSLKKTEVNIQNNKIIKTANLHNHNNIVLLLWEYDIVQKTLQKDDNDLYQKLIQINIEKKLINFNNTGE